MASPQEIVMKLTEATARQDNKTQASLIEQLRNISERKQAEKRQQQQQQLPGKNNQGEQPNNSCSKSEASKKRVTFAPCNHADQDEAINNRSSHDVLLTSSPERGASPAGSDEHNQADGSGGDDDNEDESYPKSPCSWFSSFASMDATHAPPAYYRDNMVGTVASMVEVAARAWSLSAGPKSTGARLAEDLCDLIADMEAVLAGQPRRSPRDIQARLYDATTTLQVLCKTAAYPSPPLPAEPRFYDMVRQRVSARREGRTLEHVSVEHVPHG